MNRLAPVAVGQDPLFVYGTLMFPEVLDALLGRVPATEPATIAGWRAATLAGRVYPGLQTDPAGTAVGRLVTGLTDQEWAALDEFEDDAYHLHPVRLNDGRSAWAYVVREDDDPATPLWDADGFRRDHLHAYTSMCLRIRTARTPSS